MSFTIQTIQEEIISAASTSTFTLTSYPMANNISVAEFNLSVLAKNASDDYFSTLIAQTVIRDSAGVVTFLSAKAATIPGVGSGAFGAMTDVLGALFDISTPNVRLRITQTAAISAIWLVHGTVKIFY